MASIHRPAHRREQGFTLIELLVVIIIIGILAAIAIPLFTAQKARAQDAKTIGDVRNLADAVETALVDRSLTVDKLSKDTMDYSASSGVLWGIKGNSATGGYCIAAYNFSGKKYTNETTELTYDSTAGGMGKSSGSCAGSTPSPTAANATAAAPAALVTTSQSDVWSINGEDYLWQIAVDSSANSLYVADYSGTKYGLWQVNMSTGASTLLNTEHTYLGVVKVGSHIYASDSLNPANIYEINPTTGASTLRWTSPTVSQIRNLATDGTSLYAARKHTGDVVKLAVGTDGSLSSPTVAMSGLTNPIALAIDSTATMMYVGQDEGTGTIKSKNLRTGDSRTVANISAGYVYSILPSTNNTLLVGTEEDSIIRSVDLSTGASSPGIAATLTSNSYNNAVTGLASDGKYVYASSINSGGPVKMGVYRF